MCDIVAAFGMGVLGGMIVFGVTLWWNEYR